MSERAQREGFGWILVQGEELDHVPADIVDQCHSRGLLCGLWEALVDFDQSVPRLGTHAFDMWVGQIEGPGQYDRVLGNLPALEANYPSMPKAIVTNGGGVTPENVKPFIDAGWAAIAEGFAREDGVDPRVRADYLVRALGFPYAEPMAGLSNGGTLADYPGITSEPIYSVFSAEGLWQA